MSELSDEVKRLKNLKQNKNKATHLLEKDAQKNIWKKQVDIESRFDETEDKKRATKLFDDYIDNYLFESFSDVNTLADLVFEEVLKFNLQKKLQRLNTADNTFIPEKLVGTLHDVEAKCHVLKEVLGINKKNEQKDDLTALQQLQKRFKLYIPFHRHQFETVCPKCGNSLLLRRKVKDFEIIKHPFFAGRMWYNRSGIELVKAGIISKEIYAFIHHTSVEMVDWSIKHEHDIITIDDIEEEKIKEFIQGCPHLKEAKVPKEITEK